MRAMKEPNESGTAEVSWTAMMGLLGGRLAAISGFLVFLSFILAKDGLAFYALIAFAYIITIPYSLWMRNQDRMRRLAPLQFLTDLVLVSGLVYFTGGHASDLTLLYPLIILSAGIVLPLTQTVQITALSILSYVLIVLLMARNILIPYAPVPFGAESPRDILGTVALRIFIFMFFGLTSAYMSRRCDYISKKEKQFSLLAEIIFKNIKTGLLLLDANDDILMANDRACELLGRKAPELAGTSLSALEAPPPADEGPDGSAGCRWFRRADGSLLPAGVEEARLTLPAETIPNITAPAHSLVDTRIISFTDLTRLLHLQKQAGEVDRIKAAAEMAKEIAHHIRTPLTGIAGAAQLMQITLEDRGSKDLEPYEFCTRIVDEALRMDKVIQSFLDYADFSPHDVRELIRMDIARKDIPCTCGRRPAGRGHFTARQALPA